MTILAIDDEPFALRLVEDILASRYEVVSFGSAHDALRALGRGLEPSLILCDVSMPDLDGFTFHRLLRRNRALRGVPFIYLTALDDYDFFRRGMNLGADDYLTKPFSRAELLDTVATRLARQAALRQHVRGRAARPCKAQTSLCTARPAHGRGARRRPRLRPGRARPLVGQAGVGGVFLSARTAALPSTRERP
ncbi:MAG: response regulator [Trueperaceae bacterium]|nr:response regulator [Trueperaceae bacterium]